MPDRMNRRVVLGMGLAALTLRPAYAEGPFSSHAVSRRHLPVAGGSGYDIFSAIPRGAPPASGWPVLYMLDGNLAFDLLRGRNFAGAEGIALIGAGYPADAPIGDLRARDYTPVPLPPKPGETPTRYPGEKESGGGAGLFLTDLLGLIRSTAESLAPFNPGATGLWGHSYGGLFTLYALFRKPSAFSHYMAISPSVGYGNGALATLAHDTRPPDDGRLRPLLIELGDSEGFRATTTPAASPATLALAEMLRTSRPDLQITVKVREGDRHMDTFGGSFTESFALIRQPV